MPLTSPCCISIIGRDFLISRMEMAYRFGDIGEILFAHHYFRIPILSSYGVVYEDWKLPINDGLLRHGHNYSTGSLPWEIDFLLFNGGSVKIAVEVKTTSGNRSRFEINGNKAIYHRLFNEKKLVVGIVRMNHKMTEIPESAYEGKIPFIDYVRGLEYGKDYRIFCFFPLMNSYEMEGAIIRINPSLGIETGGVHAAI